MWKEVVNSGGMEDGKSPHVARGVGVEHNRTGHGADHLVAGFCNPVLLRGVGKAVGGGYAFGGIVGTEGSVEEFAPATVHGVAPIAVDMLDLAAEAVLLRLDPLLNSGGGTSLAAQEDGCAEAGGVVNDGEEHGVVVPIGRGGGKAEVQVDAVEGAACDGWVGWVGGSLEFGLAAGGAGGTGQGLGWWAKGGREVEERAAGGELADFGVTHVAQAVVDED